MPFAFNYAARSDVGMVRSENQDSGYAGPRLLAMADGMGGHAGGDIASSVVIGALADLDGEALGSAEASKALLRRITSANDELADMVKSDPSLHGMGTTLIAILRSHNKLVLAHIGDSRAFLARDGQLTQITKDHSFVQSLVDEGRITADEAIGHPQRSLVTRVLTGQPDDEPDVTVREARMGDRYLIASDGLTDYVAGDTIAEIVTAGDAPGATADRLVDLALKAGAPDNVTIVIGDVVDLTKVDGPPTQPQIVGAASTRTKKSTRAIPVTPAAKAAALTREATGEDDDEVTLAEEGPAGPGRWWRRAAVLAVVLVVLGGGAYAAYDWSQGQYFVGAHDGKVAIYQGVSQDLGPIALSHVEEASDVVVSDLPDFYRTKVEASISKDTLKDAEALVEELRLEASRCAVSRATGGTCATDDSTTPTPTTTTTSPSTTTTTPTTTTSSSTTTGTPSTTTR
ncbi:PP2C family serine/threonine-protein phosphatase [Phycicoccus sp. Root101]|uniref:PP2C family protein-serine/threonine phosphatase n=1 Tax=Phycicoccus sp. Root101 TaxID=1736421 RepID=UPI000703161B|nr:protein phosphatase 2C domain-containing protein [Phycicoccus sp. Root101]KQU68261.1 serine/threonine protein phosphatase [Phycicoccus sp. Root101]